MPAPPAPRRGRRQHSGKHDAILDHARRMFTALGFSGTSMDELADAAGVAKATIYSHFDSKEALFEAVLRDLVRQLPTPDELVGGARGPLPARLTRIAHEVRHFATSPLMHDIQRLLALPLDATERNKDAFWRECVAPYQQAFAALLREETAAGRLRIADADTASSQFFSLAASEPFVRMLMGEAPDPATTVDAQVDAAVAAFLRAHGAGPAG